MEPLSKIKFLTDALEPPSRDSRSSQCDSTVKSLLKYIDKSVTRIQATNKVIEKTAIATQQKLAKFNHEFLFLAEMVKQAEVAMNTAPKNPSGDTSPDQKKYNFWKGQLDQLRQNISLTSLS